jgi:HlyD family secretion protein/epimerase transport system membrane fusion protein
MSPSRGDVPPTSARFVSRSLLLPRLKGPLVFAFTVVVIFFGGFTAWGSLVPLAGGSVAPAVINPEGDRRKVQHREGGIVAEIFVREGETVEKGQELLIFEDLVANSMVAALESRRWLEVANLSRLAAEDNGTETIVFPLALREASKVDPAISSLLASQEAIIRARLEQQRMRRNIIRKEIAQERQILTSLDEQVRSVEEQRTLIIQEIEDKKRLVQKNLAPKPQLLALQRIAAELRGESAGYRSRIAEAQQAVNEKALRLAELDLDFLATNAQERDKRLASLVQINKELDRATDVLKRTIVTAPVAGTVHALSTTTLGGVVGPGHVMMEIVPSADELLVEARVPVNDVDVVAAGDRAVVWLSAFSSNATPRVDGTVLSVAADSSTDRRSGESFYRASISVPDEEVQKLGEGVELVAGMAAHVMIVSTHRTFWSYISKPVVESFSRAFRDV